MSKSLLSGIWSGEKTDSGATPPTPPGIIRKKNSSKKMPATADPMYDSEEEYHADEYVSDTPGTPVPQKVSFAGIGDSPSTSRSDMDKDRDELLSKIHRLEMDLSQAQIDLSAEKTLRKKKERNLVKLAKELKKRQGDEVERDQELAELRSNKATMDTKLAATRLELEERVASKGEQQRTHEGALHEAERKYRDACRTHDARLAELTRNHASEIESLRRQLSSSAQDSDRLRSKLVKLEVKEAERIAETAMGGMDYAPVDYRYEPRQAARWQRYILAGFVVLFAAFYQVTGLSMDAICSPIMAGTRLDKEGTWEAPWWAPASVKEEAFQICGDRLRTIVSWKLTSGGGGRLSVSSADETPKILLDRKVSSAIVKGDRIDLLLEKKGRVEAVRLPWAM